MASPTVHSERRSDRGLIAVRECLGVTFTTTAKVHQTLWGTPTINVSTERCVCVCLKRQECRFHILPDNEIKDVAAGGRNLSDPYSRRRALLLQQGQLVQLKSTSMPLITVFSLDSMSYTVFNHFPERIRFPLE